MQKILISACLLGQQVRYDGHHCLLSHPTITRWQTEGRLLPVCPEVLGGLPTPRPPAEIISRTPLKIATATSLNVTAAFVNGAHQAQEIARQHNVLCALLKSRSPSCGRDQIYSGQFDGTLIQGNGVSAEILARAQIPVFSELELDLLIDFVDRHDRARPPASG